LAWAGQLGGRFELDLVARTGISVRTTKGMMTYMIAESAVRHAYWDQTARHIVIIRMKITKRETVPVLGQS
jgi:hypothetical protein